MILSKISDIFHDSYLSQQMSVLKRTLLICIILYQLEVHSTANPWHQQLPAQLPPDIPPSIDQQILQQMLFTNFTSNIGEILSSSLLDGFGNATKCTAKLSNLIKSLETGNPESIAFLDALGKPGPGLTTGNLLWLGDYEMCGKGALGNMTTGNIYKNCAVSGAVVLGNFPFTLSWTGCSPPECKGKADLQPIFEQIAAELNKIGLKTDPASWTAVCDVDQEFDAGAYAAVTIISIFGFLVVVGTVWYLLEPIIVSFMEREKDDTAVLVEAEESPGEDVDKQGQPKTQANKYQTSNQPESLLGRFVKCFALQKTMDTLFSTTTKPGQVLCLNGIRVLSINWVVLGHAYAFSLSAIGGYSYISELIKRKGFMVVLNGFPSVDSFFALSGFLVTYLILKQLAKSGGLSPLQWIAFYVHRYLRLTAPYLVAMLLEGWLYRLVMTGPRAQQMTNGPSSSHGMCEKYWYTNLLYINNLVPWKATAACLGQGWYLANDMQFFFLAPIFVVLLFRKPLAGLLGTVGAIICSAVATAVITAHYHLGPVTIADTNQDEFWLLYNKPWIRITPYLVGILGGWFYWKWGESITAGVKTLPKWLKVCSGTPIWGVTAAVQYAVVFGLYNDVQNTMQHHTNPSETVSVSYQSLAKIAWSLSLTIQILLCQCGMGGFINSLLSWNGWLILSRLTYSVFLLHLGLQGVLVGQMRHTFFINPDFEFAVFYLGFLAMAYLSAAVLYLVVEQPVANVEGMTYRKNR